MGIDLAAANVNRSYSLAATSIAIFTFMLIFLYPRFASGEVNPLLFQATLVVMGLATFSFVFASFFYYGLSPGPRTAASVPRPSMTPERPIASPATTCEAPWTMSSRGGKYVFLRRSHSAAVWTWSRQ
jgi:hypothetical protein